MNLINNTTLKGLIPAIQTAAATITGSAVDLKGMGRNVLVVLDIGATNGNVDVVIEESDDGTIWTPLHTFAQQNTAALLEADLTPTKQQIRAVVTTSGTATTFAVLGIIYNERQIPSGI